MIPDYRSWDWGLALWLLITAALGFALGYAIALAQHLDTIVHLIIH